MIDKYNEILMQMSVKSLFLPAVESQVCAANF